MKKEMIEKILSENREKLEILHLEQEAWTITLNNILDKICELEEENFKYIDKLKSINNKKVK